MLRKISKVLGYDKNISIGDHQLWVKHAATPEELAEGLMNVKDLPLNKGCLLDFGAEQSIGLWMKNCCIELAAVVLNKQGEVTDIMQMSHTDPYKAHHSFGRYALELNPLAVKQLNIKVGSKVQL
jgi:uncharacterized membrane protein (UPF0127 family)